MAPCSHSSNGTDGPAQQLGLHRISSSNFEREGRNGEGQGTGGESADADQQLRHLLAHTPAVLYVLTKEGRNVVPTLVSENIERLLGVTVAESMTYEWWLNSLHPEDRDRAVGVLTEALNGDGYSMEYRLRHKDGSYHWVEDKNRVVRDAADKPQQMVGIWTDITERKRAEEVLRSVSSQASRWRKGAILRDLLMVLSVTLLAYVVAYYFNLFEKALRVISEQKYPFRDQVIGALAFIIVALMILSYRRWRESFREAVSHEHISEALRVLHDELDKRVQQRTAELAKANEALQADAMASERASEVLWESESRFREMLENIQLIAMTLDKEGTVTFCNEHLLRVTGWELEEVIGANWFSKFVPDANVAMKTEFLETIAVGEIPTRYENRIKTRTGELREVVWNNTILRDIAGNIVGTASLGEDATERKRTEERLREQADIIERAQDAIIIRDCFTDRVTVWNSGAERLYGWSAKEATGQILAELTFPRHNHEPLVEQLVLTGGFFGEVTHHAKDGHEVLVNARVTLIRNEDGSPRSVLSIDTDITEQKKLKSQLLRAQRLESIGTLASGLSHDLNNILSPILLATPILRSNPPPEENEKFLNIIEASAQRGANIVKQVLTFARGTKGDRILLQPIYLLEEIAKIIKETFSKTVRLRTSYPEDLRLVEGDPTQLHQVLLNLCLNARDAMPDGGSLSLTATNFDVDEQYATMTPGLSAGPHILISVVDTGTGIPPHIIDKIFDPFFTTKELSKGTGLGLSSSLGIVKNHGGLINVYSDATGTTFRILLPSVASAAQADGPEMQVKIPTGHGETILIVDDESAIREVAKAVLSKSGYKVLAADDGPAALALFARRWKEIDVVLTDLVMPIMNGVMLARTLRTMDAKTKIIVSSARDADCNPNELTDIGVQGFLHKPYTRETLMRTIDNVLHPRRGRTK